MDNIKREVVPLEKYSNIETITKKFLHGNLSKLLLEYDDSESTLIDVVYEDENHYNFDYKLEVSNSSHNVHFISHFCEYQNEHIDLKRDKRFEIALLNYLFQEKKET